MGFLNYRKQSREVQWGSDGSGMTLEQINAGSLLRIADALEHFNDWARPFPGCTAAKALIRIASKGIRIRYELHIKITWPWKRARKGKAGGRRGNRAH